MAIITNGTILNTLGYKLPTGIEITSIDDLKYLNKGGNLSQLANQIFSDLINKVGATYINGMNFKNPFKRFLKSKLDYAVIIEDIYVKMPQGEKWSVSVDGKRFVDRNQSPEVVATYKDENYQSFYPITLDERLIAKAFKSRTGLQSLFNSVMNQINNRLETDMYNYAISTLSLKDAYSTNQKIEIAKPVDEATAKAFVKRVALLAKKFTRPSNAYNSLAVDACNTSDELVLILRDDVAQNIDTEWLAGVFNLDKVKIGVSDIMTIEQFGKTDGTDSTSLSADDTILGVLMNAEAMFIVPTYEMSTEFHNGLGRYINLFKHNDLNIGFKLGLNRVMFTTPAQQNQSNSRG